ncbi:hypothetical protein ROZALSC1DRAFT_23469 [Rozella allomycis CSF55]|uniref:Dynein heavy chain domain-containing protein n=1 Tax=Rozella allomycis (strain CSF55) TaxID=988480 RepID=A0A4P9YHL9_ROZAC|nr:hypothetical protein ROZALSC1DRAFT_23469 [Rozella allomycis CSF55]
MFGLDSPLNKLTSNDLKDLHVLLKPSELLLINSNSINNFHNNEILRKRVGFRPISIFYSNCIPNDFIKDERISILFLDFNKKNLSHLLFNEHLNKSSLQAKTEYTNLYVEMINFEQNLKREERLRQVGLCDVDKSQFTETSYNLAHYEENYRKKVIQLTSMKKEFFKLSGSEKKRNIFQSAAEFYLLLNKLQNIHSCYKFNLNNFLENFRNFTNEVDANWFKQFSLFILKDLNSKLEYSIFNLLLFYISIKSSNENIPSEYWEFLLYGKCKEVICNEIPPNPAASWLDKKSWESICHLGQLQKFSKLVAEFSKYANKATTPIEETSWEELQCNKDSENCIFPGKSNQNLNKLEKLIVLRIIKPECFKKAIFSIINEFPLGDELKGINCDINKNSSFSLVDKIYENISSTNQFLFITRNDIDVYQTLKIIAEKNEKGNIVQSVLISKFTEFKFLNETLMDCIEKGKWLYLQDIHESIDLINKVLAIIDSLKVKSNFKLLMSCDYKASVNFSVEIFEKCNFNILEISHLSFKQKVSFLYEFIHSHLTNAISQNKFVMKKVKIREIIQLYSKEIDFEEEAFNSSNDSINSQQSKYQKGQAIKLVRDSLSPIFQVVFSKIVDQSDFKILQMFISEIISSEWDEKDSSDDLISFNPLIEFYHSLISAQDYSTIKIALEKLPEKLSPNLIGLQEVASSALDALNSSKYLHLLSIILPVQKTNFNILFESKVQKVVPILQEWLAKLSACIIQKNVEFTISSSTDSIIYSNYTKYHSCLKLLIEIIEQTLQSIRSFTHFSIEINQFVDSVNSDIFPNFLKSDFPFASNIWFSFSSWIANFVSRLEYVNEWYNQKHQGFEWPIVHDFSKMIHPEPLLAAFLKDHSTQSKEPMELLEFEANILSTKQNTIATKGYYICGLSLRNAVWDFGRGNMRDAKSNEFNCKIPCIWIQPVVNPQKFSTQKVKLTNQNQNLSKRIHTKFKCPLFCSSLNQPSIGIGYQEYHQFDFGFGYEFLSSLAFKKDLVGIFFLVNSDVPVKHWIKRRTHFICQ